MPKREFSMSALLFRDQSIVSTAQPCFFKRLCLLSLLVFLMLTTTEATAMAIGEKLYLMSEISGTITLNGKPAAGATLKRKVRKAHSHAYLTDEATADENGYFLMPAVTERKVIHKIFPMEFVVPSLIFVNYQGEEYKIWSSTKREPEANTENRGRPLVVQCELTAEERIFGVNSSPFTTKCVWGVEVDAPKRYGPPGSGN
jgi:hypothetical protein